ncbi:MAG TPA: hybrid sensor histidine kinase/response regulator [Aquabacterium sp.]|uniref:hybrid sensor histidine kinase/response regulator n=1 Tax=Aquabacterium sp. TaxID=1872578 RepID=UPI002E37FAAD|nr:hybrid sensor histidine kinase/response regulator [Aquabacterium sp.]HEX5357472.1 hybrid sensor histidine kinase/response regulator [Aquabacterium sp.]
MTWLRRSLRGLSPIEARIDLQMLQDSWRTAPGGLIGQFIGLVLMGWMIRDWPVPHWRWMVPATGLLIVWAIVVLMARHFRRFGIPASGYERWRMALLWWHGAQGTSWGLMAVALLGEASSDWKLTFVAAIIVYCYTIMLVTVHDWAVSFMGAAPLLVLAAGRLLVDQAPSSNYLAVVMIISLTTCMIVSLNISRRLREGALLRHENADLVLQLRDEINKVTQAKARAETADRQKSEFFASASHDLRQPLHVMMLLSSALKPHVEASEGATLLSKIHTALGSLSTMFEKMFDVARIDAQRIDYKAQALPLAALWSRLDNEFSVLCENKGLRWRIDPTEDWVHADPHVLERILRNLLNNAVRYTEQGEVHLRARARGPSIVCQVWDTGVGVQRQHRHRIFEDYFQASNQGRRSSEGLGLGLAVVRRLSMLGPTPVTLLSRPGRGSCFAVRVPRLIPAGSEGLVTRHAEPPVRQTTATARPTEAEKRERHGGVIVLIDDEPDVLDGTSLVLRQQGWQVAAASTPDGAMDAVIHLQEKGLMPEGDMPVALISDHRLGLSINGLDAIKQLRYEFGDELPAFLLTGEATPGLATDAQAMRVQLLHKPIQADRLLRLLQEVTTDAA